MPVRYVSPLPYGTMDNVFELLISICISVRYMTIKRPDFAYGSPSLKTICKPCSGSQLQLHTTDIYIPMCPYGRRPTQKLRCPIEGPKTLFKIGRAKKKLSTCSAVS
jgi:hypothetical protein